MVLHLPLTPPPHLPCSKRGREQANFWQALTFLAQKTLGLTYSVKNSTIPLSLWASTFIVTYWQCTSPHGAQGPRYYDSVSSNERRQIVRRALSYMCHGASADNVQPMPAGCILAFIGFALGKRRIFFSVRVKITAIAASWSRCYFFVKFFSSQLRFLSSLSFSSSYIRLRWLKTWSTTWTWSNTRT